MKKKIHIGDGYDRIVEQDADGTIHEVTPEAKAPSTPKANPEDDAAIDKYTRTGKTSSNVWI